MLISGTVTRTKNADNLLVQPTAANSDGMFVTTNTVDLTDYAKLKIEYIGAGTNGWIALSAGSNKTEDAYPTRETNVAGAALTDSATRAITEVDIASITGSHYIKIGSAVGAITGAYVNAYEVWLE